MIDGPLTVSGSPNLLWLLPMLPLAAAIINLFTGKRLGKAAGILASVSVGLSFLLSLLLVGDLLRLHAEDRVFVKHVFDWISVGRFSVGADFRLDALSATMILVITGIGFLIHVYAIGYM